MSTTTIKTTATSNDAQVRIQLSTRDESLEFPEKPGPILVSTSKITFLLAAHKVLYLEELTQLYTCSRDSSG
jgi:hypothetical protein